MTTTRKGDKLADALLPVIGQTEAIRETCAKIARHSATLDRLNERECSVEMTDRQQARHDAEVERISNLVRNLVRDLPETDDGPFTAQIDGDPRGWAVKIIAPSDETRNAVRWNTWGGAETGVAVGPT